MVDFNGEEAIELLCKYGFLRVMRFVTAFFVFKNGGSESAAPIKSIYLSFATACP
jgi:hypothetical protein